MGDKMKVSLLGSFEIEYNGKNCFITIIGQNKSQNY